MKKKILVVDDEASLTRLIKANLERTGKYEVMTENHEEMRWVTYKEAQAILPPRLKAILNWADWLVQRELEGD